MNIALIAAVAENRVIGQQGSLPWNLPADTDYFKSKIQSQPVLMGRKSFEAEDAQFSDNVNMVMSRRTNLNLQPGFVLLSDLPEALDFFKSFEEEEIFILGGEAIYKMFLPYAQTLYLTRVHAQLEGDTFFPQVNWSNWKETSSQKHPADADNAYACSFKVFQRIA